VASYIRALSDCRNFDTGNKLALVLPSIKSLRPDQIDEMIAAYNDNPQLFDSFGFNGKYSSLYGDGLVPHLNRLGGRTFYYDVFGKIRLQP